MNSRYERRLREEVAQSFAGTARSCVGRGHSAAPQFVTWSDRVVLAFVAVDDGRARDCGVTIRAWPDPRAASFSDPSPQELLADAETIEETGRDIGLPDTMTRVARASRQTITIAR